MRAPDVAVQPSERVEVLDRRAAVQLLAVRLLLDRLGEMRVQVQAEAASELGRLGHQPARDGERRARRDRDLDPRARARLVQLADEALGVGEHRVDVLDELVGRQPAVGDAEVHRAARRDEPAAELGRRLHLRLDEPGAAAREDVVVIEDGRAAREHQLGDAGACRRVLGLGVDPRPGRVELDEPLEQRRLLGAGARERLVEVVVGVDEAGRDDRAAEPDALVRVRLRSRPDRRDEAVLDEDPAVLVLGLRVVHRQHVCGGEQGLHRSYRIVAHVEVITPRTLEEALRIKSERPDARPIAGGTDLLVELNFDRARPETILNLAEVPELKGWARENGSVRLARRPDVHRGDAAGARRAAAGARRGLAHGRLAADPQPRHDRRQPRHRLSRRRRTSAAPRRGRDGGDREHPRRPHAAADRVLPRPEAERARGGRARARGPRRPESGSRRPS